MKNKEVFISDLITVFPVIRAEILDEDYLGLVSLQVGCFRRFTQDAIDRNDLAEVQRCFDFVNENFEVVEFEVENSLVVSYLGKLNIIKSSSVEMLLPARLKDIKNQLASYYESMSKDKKLAEFIKG